MRNARHNNRAAKTVFSLTSAAMLLFGAACGSALPLPGPLAGAASTLEASRSQAEPTAQALATELAAGASIAATALAEINRPQSVDHEQASEVITLYAQEILGRPVTIVRAGGLTGDIERQIVLPEDAGVPQASSAAVAARTYAAVLSGGAGSVSYGTGTVSGDLTVELDAASLGAFSFISGAVPETAEAALQMALDVYPALAERSFTAIPVSRGYAWMSAGAVPGINPTALQGTLTAEEVLLAVVPTVLRRSAVSVVVGRGVFAANVLP
jgi:hypothetical protein